MTRAVSVAGVSAGHVRRPAGRSLASWLGLAATPTFAIMALLSTFPDGGQTRMLCSSASTSPLSGMVPMYLLMSLFHLPPWLRLTRRDRGSSADARMA